MAKTGFEPCCLFTSAEGGPIRHHNLYMRHYRPAVIAAGLVEGVRFHDLRHTCAAILIEQGWSPKHVQTRLGHASIRTTLDRYGHLFEGHDAALLDRLDETYRRPDADSVRIPDGSVISIDTHQKAETAP